MFDRKYLCVVVGLVGCCLPHLSAASLAEVIVIPTKLINLHFERQCNSNEDWMDGFGYGLSKSCQSDSLICHKPR